MERKKNPHYKHWIMHILQKENSVAPKKDDKRLIMRDKWIITAAVGGCLLPLQQENFRPHCPQNRRLENNVEYS